METNTRRIPTIWTKATEARLGGLGTCSKRRTFAPIYKIYNGQVKKRDIRTVNQVSVFHLAWTVLYTMKEELDEEMAERNLMNGQMKRWSRKVADEFSLYLSIFDKIISKDHLTDLAEDYEGLDSCIRKACNIEQRTVISFGRLSSAMVYLHAFTNVLNKRFSFNVDKTDAYCRSLSIATTALSNAMEKYIQEASERITPIEVPVTPENFTRLIMEYMRKDDETASTDNQGY